MSRLLLLLGPPGVGKTTLIRHLCKLDNRFRYISPFVTRPLREGEHDKIFVTADRLEEMQAAGEILVVNELYGIKYGTPRAPIEECLRRELFPVLDWPVQRIPVLVAAFSPRLFRVYLRPPSLEELERRLRERDGAGFAARLDSAARELCAFASGEFDEVIDVKVVSEIGQAEDLANLVRSEYMKAL